MGADAEDNLKQHGHVRASDGHNERRRFDRRSLPRPTNERRRADRRRQTLRSLLFAAAAFSASPAWLKVHRPSLAPLTPRVSVQMSNFVPLRPEDAYEDLIQEAAQLHGIDAALIRAVMKTESAFNPAAVSPVGAMGLMQLMPALAKEMGVEDPFNPRENVMGGARYLAKLLDMHNGNIKLALASYNAGPGNVRRYRGIPPFRETRNYVRKITGLLSDTAE
jgi:soluble lytic murein transglycosylase-like protein